MWVDLRGGGLLLRGVSPRARTRDDCLRWEEFAAASGGSLLGDRAAAGLVMEGDRWALGCCPLVAPGGERDDHRGQVVTFFGEHVFGLAGPACLGALLHEPRADEA